MKSNEAKNKEAYPACRFYVEIGGTTKAVFTELSGLQVETEVEEYAEGGNNAFVHYLPGRTKVGRLTLKRGMTASDELFKWYLHVAQGKVERRNVSIIMYDLEGNVLTQWDFRKAYPVRWTGPQFSADGSAAAVETLELAHDGFAEG